eukprot:UN06633
MRPLLSVISVRAALLNVSTHLNDCICFDHRSFSIHHSVAGIDWTEFERHIVSLNNVDHKTYGYIQNAWYGTDGWRQFISMLVNENDDDIYFVSRDTYDVPTSHKLVQSHFDIAGNNHHYFIDYYDGMSLYDANVNNNNIRYRMQIMNWKMTKDCSASNNSWFNENIKEFLFNEWDIHHIKALKCNEQKIKSIMESQPFYQIFM